MAIRIGYNSDFYCNRITDITQKSTSAKLSFNDFGSFGRSKIIYEIPVILNFYFPVKFAFLRSTKAVVPSLKSSVENALPNNSISLAKPFLL